MTSFKDHVVALMQSLSDEGKGENLELTIELAIDDLWALAEEDVFPGYKLTSFRFKTPYGWAHVKTKGARSFGER